MKVAVTSQNFKTVTAHAGKARRFIVFEIEPGSAPVEVDRIDLPKDMSFHAYHGNDPHPVEIAGVERLATGGCGDGFRTRMARLGIQLHLTEETDPALAAVETAETPSTFSSMEAGKGSHRVSVHHDRHQNNSNHHVEPGQNRRPHSGTHHKSDAVGKGGCGCGH